MRNDREGDAAGGAVATDASVADLAQLLRSMRPSLNAGIFVFACIRDDADPGALSPIATFRETEGITVIVEEERARQQGLAVLLRAAWITLAVHSDLHAVGFTAAIATALSRAGISCNVVAAAFHDHLFVPVERANEAMGVLERLQRGDG